MRNIPITTVNVSIECQDFYSQSIQGKVTASKYNWQFTWKFGRGELIIYPPLGRALIKDSLERFLIKDDYRLEPGEIYQFNIRAKF